MDFTLKTYINLLQTLKSHNSTFLSFSDYIQLNKQTPSPLRPPSPSSSEALAKEDRPIIILRHDVDKLPQNALRFAQIEHDMGIKVTYYFRAVPVSWNERIIKEIHDLGHEIGYHYENLTTCNGDMNKAIEDFKYNLEKLRNLTPVSSICMHGSPRSKWDNKDLWKKYNYRDFGIIGEPYFDVDFEDMLYLTDTGRRWNGHKFSIRDKGLGIRKQELGNPYHYWRVKPKMGSLMNMTQKSMEFQSRYNFRSTNTIISAAEKGKLPDRIMMTFHPQRWTDRAIPWVKELVWQNVKNVGKWGLIRIRQ